MVCIATGAAKNDLEISVERAGTVIDISGKVKISDEVAVLEE